MRATSSSVRQRSRTSGANASCYSRVRSHAAELCYAFVMKTPIQRAINTAMLALLAGMLAACAGLSGPRDIEVPLQKLQSGLDRRFPLNNRALDLFDVQLTRPQLTMMGESGRIGLALDASVAPPLLRKQFRGSLALSGRLYLDPARNAVMVAEPRVERFVIDGVDERAQRQLAKVASTLMDSVMADVPLYHFRPEELRYGGVQFVPTRIVTTGRGLLVSVAPAAR